MHFRKSDVIDTGNIYDTTRYPLIDVKNGGTTQGEIDALNSGQGRSASTGSRLFRSLGRKFHQPA